MMYQEAILYLGLNYPVTQDSIKKAYRRLAREYHPDAGGSEEHFKRLTQAYQVALQGPEYTASDTSRNCNNGNTKNYNGTYYSPRTYYDPVYSYIIYLAIAGIMLGALMIFDMYFGLRFMAQSLLNSINYFHVSIALIIGFVVISICRNPARLLIYGAFAIFIFFAFKELSPYYWQITDMFNQFSSALNLLNSL